MLYAAEAFALGGDTVCIAGFEKADGEMARSCEPLDAAVSDADLAVLPVRPIQGAVLNAPFSDAEIPMSRIGDLIGGTPVFCGCADSVRPFVSGAVYDYAVREDFCIRNAALTAEGAVGRLITDYPGAVFGAEILVLGYGRIGRILSRCLRDLGAAVTVAARTQAVRTWARVDGHRASDFALTDPERYEVIINTVPAPVLSAEMIGRLRRDVFLMDLASLPGGVDQSAAQARGIRCIHALGLPGKTSPAAAGRIITDTIRNIIKEENGEKDNSRLRDDRFLLHL